MSSKPAAEGGGPPLRARRGWSLTARLTFWYTASAALLVVLAAGLLYTVLVRDVDREDDGLLHDHALLVDSLLSQKLADPGRLLLELHASRRALGAEAIPFRIVDAAGATVLAPPDIDSLLPKACFPPPAEGEAGAVDVGEGGHVYRLMTAPLQATAVGGPGASIQMA